MRTCVFFVALALGVAAAAPLEEVEELEEELIRERRSPQGGWNLGVNKNSGTGPQFRGQAAGSLYSNNKFGLSGNGYLEAGKGRKPSMGAGLALQDANNRGSLNVFADKQGGQRTRYGAEASGTLWQSRNGNAKLEAYGNYNAGGGVQRDYGGGVKLTGRFKRDAEEDVQQLSD